MSFHLKWELLLACCFLTYAGEVRAPAATRRDVTELLQQLQAPETSDRAAAELLKLAKGDVRVRRALAERLPGIIAKGPPNGPQRDAWANAADLAGELKIKEACQALAKWMHTPAGPLGEETELGIVTRLLGKPAAKALAEIGDPSLPFVAPVLSRGDDAERWDAVYILNLIGSPAAKKLLRERVSSEPNPNLRGLIQRMLGAERPSTE